MYSPETTTVIDLRSVRLAARVVLKLVIINMYRILGVIPKGRSSQCRPRSTLEVNTEMDYDDVDLGLWTGYSWLRLCPVVGFYERD